MRTQGASQINQCTHFPDGGQEGDCDTSLRPYLITQPRYTRLVSLPAQDFQPIPLHKNNGIHLGVFDHEITCPEEILGGFGRVEGGNVLDEEDTQSLVHLRIFWVFYQK
jgi:hypothetical protein